MEKAQKLKNKIMLDGGVTTTLAAQVPAYYVYIVINEQNILAIGKGSGSSRIRSLFPKSSGTNIHNKSFIVAANAALYGNNEIIIKKCNSKEEAVKYEKIYIVIFLKPLFKEFQNQLPTMKSRSTCRALFDKKLTHRF